MVLPKKSGPPLATSKLTGDSRPFGLLWLDSLFQEIFLPNGAWQKVLLKVNNNLAENIKKQFDHAERKQMIFELMGAEFVQTNFPHEQYDPNIIMPPAVSVEERKKLQVDAQNWLQKEMAKVTAEVGCERPLPGQDLAPPSTEMQEFLRFVRYLATRNMNRHLHLQEKEVMRAWENYQWEQTEAKQQEKEIREKVRLKREYERLTGTTPNPRSILRSGMTPFSNKPPPTAGSIFTTASENSTKTTANIKGAMYGAADDPPTFWGMQSNCVGRSVVSVLKRDPRRYGEVAARLHGRQLPSTLRMYLWLDMLLRQERERLKDSNVEKLVRERFGKALSRGIGDLQVKRATHSPISGLIDNAVIEIYDITPGMRMFLEYDQHMKEAAKALNILYVYDRTYEPYLIYWLFPIQMAFQDFSGQSEHVYDLAMYLDLLNKNCFPKWPSVFAVAERVMTRLENVDKELHDHLESISLVNVNINPKEFLVQLIHEEKTKAQELIAALPDRSNEISKDLLANPRIFLRKWVGEGFASVLDTQAVLYVWDQCFMQRWDPQVLEDICIVLLLLLRHKFLEAEEYKDMRRVFQREPCKLYTMDIQRAWVHVQRHGDHDLVHPMNRQAYKVSKPVVSSPIEPAISPGVGPSPAPSILSDKPVPMIGLKHFRLDVDIPAESNLYSVDVNPSTIKLHCKLYFGSVHISTQTSTVTPTSKGVKVDKYGAKSFHAVYPKQKFIFASFDSAQYDLEQEMGGYPYAIIQATCEVTDSRKTTTMPLGWARIKLFRNKSEVKNWTDPTNMSQWILVAGDLRQRLSSGEAPEYGTAGTTHVTQVKALIGHNSWLNSLVFDPNNEPSTPTQSLSPVPVPKTPPPPSPKPKQKTPVPSRTQSPELPGTHDKFVLYVDGVDNIPDNATITKVTGRLVKTGNLVDLQDILALPNVSSRARCPCFAYKHIINEAKVETDAAMLLLLRIYTVDRMSGELKVIGSCLCPVFDQKTAKVLVGGHQRVLHYGMPDLKKGLGSISYASLDAAPRIPGCTIYYRLARYTVDDKPAPSLNVDNYPLTDQDFNESEKRVMHSYKSDQKHPKTTNNMITLLQRLEKVNSSGQDPLLWLQDRLDQKTRLPANQAAGYLELAYMVHYRLDKGINVFISRAHGLPEGMYVQCFARVYAGDQVQGEKVTEEGYGRDDEQLVTQKIDMDSHQVAPRWMDTPMKINPHWDINTFLLVQLFGLSIKYTANPDHKKPGQLTDRKGQDLKLGPDNIIGWTMVPLFDDIYTDTGEHHVPLFKGQPDQDLLAECSKRPIVDVLKDHPKHKNNKLDFASMVVTIWDGHFLETELLETLERHDNLLAAVASVDSYKKLEREPKGKKINQFVLDGLTKKEQKQGTSGQAYTKEKAHFSETIEKAFHNLMDVALLEAGYGPL